MPTPIEQFLSEYGYLAILMGAMIEGESIILTASALAAMGYFDIVRVGVITFLGTLVADQAIYIAGYFYGKKSIAFLIRRFPRIEPLVNKALSFLKKHEVKYILSFRFIYGIRIISPFIIGAQGISFRRFSTLNVASALIWTILSCAAGYFLGNLISQFTQHVGLVMVMLLISIIILTLAIKWIQKKRNKV